EIALGVEGVDAEGGGRLPNDVLAGDISAFSCEAASLQRGLAMETGSGVARCDYVDHAAELTAVLGGVVPGEHVHRLQIFHFKRRSEGGGAIVERRDTVDYVLHTVLGPARVKHAIGFEEPSGLRVDQVQNIAAGL